MSGTALPGILTEGFETSSVADGDNRRMRKAALGSDGKQLLMN